MPVCFGWVGEEFSIIGFVGNFCNYNFLCVFLHRIIVIYARKKEDISPLFLIALRLFRLVPGTAEMKLYLRSPRGD